MTTSLINADSMLVIDLGAITTRALLFDVVDGRYRLLAFSSAPSTAGAPYHDVSEGVITAIEGLQNITGLSLLDDEQRLIQPSAAIGQGVDHCALTFSVGQPVKILAVGLLDEVSLESVRRLASTVGSAQVETLSLNDRRRPEARLDAILRFRPDVILAAGGAEHGAERSVLELLEPVARAVYLLPPDERPALLFAGNSALHAPLQAVLGETGALHLAANVRPNLESEQLEPAQAVLNDLLRQLRTRQIGGLEALQGWTSGRVMPASAAFGRMVRFLSAAHPSPKGVLGVDLGASGVTLAAAHQDQLSLATFAQFGMGQGPGRLLGEIDLPELQRWLPVEVSEETIQAYLANRALYPGAIPVSPEELALEQGLARLALQDAVRRMRARFPAGLPSPGPELLPGFEPILAMGSVLTHAPSLAQAMLILLDGLQPTGATTFILDPYQVTSALGAAASSIPILAVQLLDSSAFLHLGTVLAPLSDARPGTPIMRVKMAIEGGGETTHEIKQGALELLPLPPGQAARLQLHALHRTDVGMGGPGRGGGLKVVGGAMGVVIDARGRPLRLPDDSTRRTSLIKKWLWTLGG